LSTSERKKRRIKWSTAWLFIALFCAAFSAVYEIFSHGVYSLAMIFLFIWPLLLGALPCFFLEKKNMAMPGRLYQDGIVILTLASLIAGILEIYGTSSPYTVPFFWAGIAVAAIGAGMDFYMRRHTVGNRLQKALK
jgi:peptidoglycan/LPS O-acetylase OafA/YrhL